VLAVFALLGVLAVEPRREQPLVDLRFFAAHRSPAPIAIALVTSAGLGGFPFVNTLYFEDVRDYSALRAGLMILPLAVGQGASAQISGRLVASRGARIPLLTGGALLTIGSFLLVPLTIHTPPAYLLITYGVFGIGAGMVAPPISSTAASGPPRDQAGLASALASSAREFGFAVGVGITGAVVANTGPGFTSRRTRRRAERVLVRSEVERPHLRTRRRNVGVSRAASGGRGRA
jgi:predicted MFS family arabinose efflux permease